MKSFKVLASQIVYSNCLLGQKPICWRFIYIFKQGHTLILKESNIASADDVYKFVNRFIDNFHNEISSDNINH